MISKTIREEVYNCIKCGICLTPCPVYKQRLMEPFSPRGKVQLIRNILEGRLNLSENFIRILFTCLLCETCTVNCPSGLKVDFLMKAMRTEVIDKFGLSEEKKVLFEFLTGQRPLPANPFREGALNNILTALFPIKGKAGTDPFNKSLHPNGQSFLNMVSEVIKVPQPKGRVLYFTGCATNYLDGAVGRATVDVLSRLGVEVIIPKEQLCCGLPIFFAGDPKMALPNILKNVALFNRQDVDAVVVECATCGAALKKEYPHILREMGEKTDKALALSQKVMDISQYLMRFDFGGMLRPVPGRVTYHDPCHLLRSQGVKNEPRSLLRKIPELEFAEMDGADVCCGGGGIFQWEHPEISEGITARKIENIENTGATFVATGCPSCRLQISGNLKKDGLEVVHPVQLLARSLGG
ncbi:MAG: (Fe-S)-binding protein [Deltaproteobacteria bacterium]|nr:(Fe-S)-binding protein [Deltaproteobacteria bacterium]